MLVSNLGEIDATEDNGCIGQLVKHIWADANCKLKLSTQMATL